MKLQAGLELINGPIDLRKEVRGQEKYTTLVKTLRFIGKEELG